MERNYLELVRDLSGKELEDFNGGSKLTYWIFYGLGKMWKAYEESMSYNQMSASSAQ
jgi:hypothetical protein